MSTPRGGVRQLISLLAATEGMDPASFSWDVYSRPPVNTVILRKAVFLGIHSILVASVS